MIDNCVVSKWSAYQIANPDEKLSFLDVRRREVLLYLYKKTGSASKRRGPQGNKLMEDWLAQMRDLIMEIPSSCELTQKRCAYCKKKTKKVSNRCHVSHHDKCFVPFHTIETQKHHKIYFVSQGVYFTVELLTLPIILWILGNTTIILWYLANVPKKGWSVVSIPMHIET
ncbi:hypothetical protein TNCT_277861 [Trichonephila clavata]|uniref:Uncharacterized protein n=1 Tax=Trichonephila clavata TaxID=2740835 RepID=A0A8X6M202_TRICU|nr:hypothetical protein TNCT_277861 [Trichonephila clavata]